MANANSTGPTGPESRNHHNPEITPSAERSLLELLEWLAPEFEAAMRGEQNGLPPAGGSVPRARA